MFITLMSLVVYEVGIKTSVCDQIKTTKSASLFIMHFLLERKIKIKENETKFKFSEISCIPE